jgi:hypothetical protein
MLKDEAINLHFITISYLIRKWERLHDKYCHLYNFLIIRKLPINFDIFSKVILHILL